MPAPTLDIAGCLRYVSSQLSERSDSGRAAAMQAYMKTDMPFYGVQKPDRAPVLREVLRRWAPRAREEYETLVSALWARPYREEKYLAQGVAVAHRPFIVPESLALYRRMITEGAWWDLVDEAATHLVRPLVLGYPDEVWPLVDAWIDDGDMWLRRAAIICQVGAGSETDTDRLFRFCSARADETGFFIRKAIGWALRDYSKTDPQAVADFVRQNRDRLSGLSYREAVKHMGDPATG